MSKIVWLVSYPKSGNTWVRFLIANLLAGPVESAASLARIIPDIHEMGPTPEAPTEAGLMKTHFPYSAALPLAAQTAGAIYVVRDPADVMMSNYHYSRRTGAVNGDDPAAFARYVQTFIGGRGDPQWKKLGMGSWDENVRSWLSAHLPFPVMRVRYEDLIADTPRVAGTLCRALGMTRTASQVTTAVEAVSFQRMRQIEEGDIRAKRVGIFYKPYLQRPIDAGLRFMRSGRSGEAAIALSPSERRQMDSVFGALRRELGYI